MFGERERGSLMRSRSREQGGGGGGGVAHCYNEISKSYQPDCDLHCNTASHKTGEILGKSYIKHEQETQDVF